MLAQCSQSLFPWGRHEPPSLSGCGLGTNLLDPQPSHSHWTKPMPGPDPQISLYAQNSKCKKKNDLLKYSAHLLCLLTADEISMRSSFVSRYSNPCPFTVEQGCSLCYLIWEVGISEGNMVFIWFTFFTSICKILTPDRSRKKMYNLSLALMLFPYPCMRSCRSMSLAWHRVGVGRPWRRSGNNRPGRLRVESKWGHYGHLQTRCCWGPQHILRDYLLYPHHSLWWCIKSAMFLYKPYSNSCRLWFL